MQESKPHIGLLIASAKLYRSLFPDMDNNYIQMVKRFIKMLGDRYDFHLSPVVATQNQGEHACQEFVIINIDVIVVVLGPYCPSGVLWKSLAQTRKPLVLWPMQSVSHLDPQHFCADDIKLSHGVHAVQDLASIFRKNGVPFAVLHQQHDQKGFAGIFDDVICAGLMWNAFLESRPIQIGGHFTDMLDLQLTNDEFLKRIELDPTIISIDAFAAEISDVSQSQMDSAAECETRYRRLFMIDESVSKFLLKKTAIAEVALRNTMRRHKSKACGLNFQTLCNNHQIHDPLHVPVSVMMSEGFGYAAEGDWVNASFCHAMQKGFAETSFSEMFSVCYVTNRLFLKHWGEGNIAITRDKPFIRKSQFKDLESTEFLIADFQFKTGPAVLLNLNSDSQGNGQLLAIKGFITDDLISKIEGPRAMFLPENECVQKILDEYAYRGGSHHVIIIWGNIDRRLQYFGRLSGFKIDYI